jgi:hypothetical protein
VTPDHYDTLGLSPTSEDVVIRAAYRALIRRYHPDGNASAEATARARAINAAYAVLIDPEKRAEYDRMRATAAWPSAPMRRSAMPVRSRLFAAASVTLLLVLVSLVIWSPLPLVKAPERVAQVPARTPVAAKEIPILPPAEESAAILDAVDEEVANPQLDEPPPAPPPPAPLTGLTVPAAPSRPSHAQATLAKPAVARPLATIPAVTDARPGFNCRIARTRVEIAVCGNANLASLDRQQAMFYRQSWVRADAARRERLQTTRDRFIVRRDGCRSITCTRAAYLARMREVSEIMIEQPKPDRMAP